MSESIAELVERFKNGDDKAFNELVRLFEKKVYAHAYQMLGNHTEADEVLQETFVRLVKNITRLKADVTFPSFVFKIATNCCIDIIRKRQRHFVNVDDDEYMQSGRFQLELSRAVPTPEQELADREMLKLINEAIAELPKRQRIAMILHDIEGFTKDEVAKMMSCPQATVRSNLHVARLKIRQKLTSLLDIPILKNGRERTKRK